MTKNASGGGSVEGHSASYERIRSKKTLAEILEVAKDFERAARDFYIDLIPKVSKNIRFLVEDLAAEEQEHYNLFADMIGNPRVKEQIRKEIRTPTEDHRFSDYVHVPDLGEAPDDQTILQYAMGREDAAMKHYAELAAGTEPGELHDLFSFLANEETKHKRELEAQYYELVFTRSDG